MSKSTFRDSNENNNTFNDSDYIGFDLSDDSDIGSEEGEIQSSNHIDNNKMDDNEFNSKGKDGKSRKELEKKRSKKAPWMVDVDFEGCRNPSQMLDKEVRAFVDFVSPSVIEHKTREYTIECIRRCITGRWKDAKVYAFGSFETRLYLPDGDIDLVVMRNNVTNYNKQSMLHTMASMLRQANLAQNVQVISKARVPIIKFTSSFGAYPIDISLNQTNGVDAGRLVNQILDNYPAARSLSMIMKMFLSQRGMNEVYTGGVSSYSVICLVVSFLQQHPKIRRGEINPMNNLGTLLVELLELYGKHFNYDATGICIEEDGYYYNKVMRGWHQYAQPYLLSIQDPQDSENDISKGSYNILNVRKTLAGAYDMLTSKLYQCASEIDAKRSGTYLRLRDSISDEERSILLSFMGISQMLINKRRLTIETYHKGVLQRYLGLPMPTTDDDHQLRQKSKPPSPSTYQNNGVDENDTSVISILDDDDDEDNDSRYLHIDQGGPSRKRQRTNNDDVLFVDSSEDSDIEILNTKSNKFNQSNKNRNLKNNKKPESSHQRNSRLDYWTSKGQSINISESD